MSIGQKTGKYYRVLFGTTRSTPESVFVFWSILLAVGAFVEYSWSIRGVLIVACNHFCCFAVDQEEAMHGEDTGDSRESLLPLHERVLYTLDVPVAGNAVQETPLDIRQVMELAGKIDSFVQISRQLD